MSQCTVGSGFTLEQYYLFVFKEYPVYNHLSHYWGVVRAVWPQSIVYMPTRTDLETRIERWNGSFQNLEASVVTEFSPQLWAV